MNRTCYCNNIDATLPPPSTGSSSFSHLTLTFLFEDIGAKTSLIDLPPRSESELDCITLHNQAIMNMDTSPNEGLEKLQYLLQNHKYPREVFPNLLLSYIKYDVS